MNSLHVYHAPRVSPALADVAAPRRRWLSLGGALGLLGLSGLLACLIEPNALGLGASLFCFVASVVCVFAAAMRRLSWIESPRPETTEDVCHE